MYQRIEILENKTKLNMRILVILLSGLIGLTAAGQETNQSQPLSFDEALQKALLQNETLQQSVMHQREREHELKAARALRLPQISVAASYMMLSDDVSIDMTGVRDAITPLYGALSQFGNFSNVPNPDAATSGMMPVLPDNIGTTAVREQLKNGLLKIENTDWNTVLQQKNFGMVSTGVVWPLFTGGKINAANRAARLRVDESSLKERQKRGALYSELTQRYFGLALAYQVKEVREEVLNAMQMHLSDAEKLYEEGIVAKAELLHAQLYHAQSEREYKKAERDYKVINESLRNTLAEDEEIRFTPITSLFYLKEIESSDFFKQMARVDNPQLLEIASKQNLAKEGVHAERSSFMPTIAAMGNYNIVDYQLAHAMPDYMAGITLSWKIFGGGATHHKYKAARLVEDQVQHIYYKATRDIETGIEKYHQEIHLALEQLEELETAKKFAAEYYRIRHQAFLEGVATSTEVVDASLAVTKVKIEQLQAAYQYEVALAQMLELAGIPEQFNHYRNDINTIQLNQ